MASSRLYYQNLCDQAHFGSFNTVGGAVAMYPPAFTPPYAYRSGAAVLTSTGAYTGVFERNYMVQVQSSTNGTFAGTRLRWSDTDDGNWNVQNIIPVSGTPISIGNGLNIIFTDSGITPQFVLNDTWRARALRPYGIAKALDGSRNTEYRSGTVPPGSTLRIGWDMGVARSAGFVAVDDHNLPSNASITLFTHATTLFTETGGTSQAVNWQPDRLAALVTTTATWRYWWLRFVCPTSPSLGYLRFSELFMGNGAVFSKAPDVGMGLPSEYLGGLDVAQASTRGATPRLYTAEMPQRTWSLVKRDATEDGGKLDAAFTYATTGSPLGMLAPFWFLPLDDNLAQTEYNSWVGSGLQRTHRFLDRWDYQTSWAQVIRTAAS